MKRLLNILKVGVVILATLLPLFSASPILAADYYCDGVSDSTEFQNALNALPASGGRITIAAGTYAFTATVSRAIDNVIIEGAGASTIINYNNSTSIFDIGVQSNWVFRDLKLDAGGIDTGTAVSWIEDNVTIGTTLYSYRSDMSFTATGDSVYAMSPTGVNDDVAISAAVAAGNNNILLGAGTWAIAGNITLASNTKMLGVGNTTILNFTDSVDSEIVIDDSSNVEIGNFKITGTSRDVGAIMVSSSAVDSTNILIHDIYMDVRGGYGIHIYPDATTHAGRYIDNVEVARVTIVSPDGFGYMQSGTAVNPTFTDSRLYDVNITDAGVAATRTGAWVTGYDFIEDADAVLDDMTVISCSGDGAWESVFHYENYAGITDCYMIQCTANDGGNKSGFTWGAGYRITTGVTLITCSATNNAGDGYDDAGAATLTNCSASGNGDADIVGTKSNYTISTVDFTGDYYANIVVTSSTAYSMLGVIEPIDNTGLVAGGYMTASGLDTDITYTGSAVPHMVANDKVLFADDIPIGVKAFKYEMGNTPNSAFYIITGYGGYITTADQAQLALGAAFSVEASGYIDASNAADKNIVYVDGEIRIYISALNTLTATAESGGGTVTLSGAIATGAHDIILSLAGGTLDLSVDGASLDSDAFVGDVVADTHDWLWTQNNVMPYAEYLKLNVGGTGIVWYQPNAIISGTTMPDRYSSTAQNGVITWGTNPAALSLNMGALVGGSVSPTATAIGVSPPIVPPGEDSPIIATPLVASSPLYPFLETFDTLTDHKFSPEWQAMAYSALLCAGFMIFAGSRTQSFFLAITAGALGLGLGFILKFFADIWIFWVFGFLAIAALLLDARKSW